MSNNINKAHLLKTLDYMTQTARRALDDLNSDACVLRDQIEALSEDEPPEDTSKG